jgi:alkylated DNA repair dioxygenase AlkB
MSSQIDLFSNLVEEVNPLMRIDDGELLYHPEFFDKSTSDHLLKTLLETIDWHQDKIKMYGKEIPLPRLSAWYGETDKPYSYSGITLQAKPWTKELLYIKERIEGIVGVSFSSVLLNRYRDGKDYVSWHADDEKELGKNPVIGSVNFGATRRFQLRRIDDHANKIELELQHGTFLVMRGTTQHYWQHQVPKTAAKIGERLNLTFRVITNIK